MSAPSAPRVALLMGTDGPGGAEMMVFRLAHELRERGCEVVPVLPTGGYGWLGGLLRGDGFEPEEVPLSTRWVDARCVRALIEVFRRHEIDVVHSHEFDFAVLGTAAARLSRRPHVITFHGGLTATTTMRRRVALRLAIGASAATVAVSAATRDRFAQDLGIGQDAFDVIHNGVPEAPGDAAAVRAEFGCRDGDVVVLAVGTLERNKGHHVLIDAMRRFEDRQTGASWTLIIAGGRGGDQHQPLLELVQERDLGQRVHIVTGRNDIADLQALADVFVMPSFVEGLPMAMLEAMVAGNAIVASDTGGIPEALSGGSDGELVPPGDVAALEAALAGLIGDPERRARLGDAAARRAQRDFTVGVMAERYHLLYERVLL
jgi:glycosyltransferase involved in cell wall biosynthesis